MNTVFIDKLPVVIKWIPYMFIDIVDKLKHIRDLPPMKCGIFIYGGIFGCGKTLSVTAQLLRLKRIYGDNLIIYCNYTLYGIEYIKFEYFEQLLVDTPPDKYIVYVIDEAGSIFNSRNYKDCVMTESDFILSLNQIRHENKSIYLCSQRFKMTDKVFRQVGNTFTECKKIWRFVIQRTYDCYDLEYQELMRPRCSFSLIFADNTLFNTYDTKELVQKLKKGVGSDEKIKLERIQDTNVFNVSQKKKKSIFKRGA